MMGTSLRLPVVLYVNHWTARYDLKLAQAVGVRRYFLKSLPYSMFDNSLPASDTTLNDGIVVYSNVRLHQA